MSYMPGSGGSGFDQATADTLYVSLTGDDMTGNLSFPGGNSIVLTGQNSGLHWPSDDLVLIQASGALHAMNGDGTAFKQISVGDGVLPDSAVTKRQLDTKASSAELSTKADVTVGTSAPANPKVGDIWVDMT